MICVGIFCLQRFCIMLESTQGFYLIFTFRRTVWECAHKRDLKNERDQYCEHCAKIGVADIQGKYVGERFIIFHVPFLKSYFQGFAFGTPWIHVSKGKCNLYYSYLDVPSFFRTHSDYIYTYSLWSYSDFKKGLNWKNCYLSSMLSFIIIHILV